MTQRPIQDPTLNSHGDEVHPAFGLISAVRTTYGGGGATLFQSDIKHGATIRLQVSGATRKRDLHTDWVHADSRTPLIEVELSEAQWASFVSSMNTTGVPCTIRAKETDWRIPELPYDPRLAHSMAEVKGAAQRLFDKAQQAMAEFDALDAKAPAKVRREAIGKLRTAVNNAESNMTFAAKQLAEHSENVVQKARADIEAMVTQHAVQLGLTAGQADGLVELPAIEGEVQA